MPVKIQKSNNVDTQKPLTLEQLNQLSAEIDVNSVHEIFKLKPVALETLKNHLKSQDSRVAIQAARLILEFGH